MALGCRRVVLEEHAWHLVKPPLADGHFVEGHGGLALVGDADGFDIQVVALLNLNKTLHNVIIDLLRVMLDPSWLLRYLLVLPCGNVKHF